MADIRKVLSKCDIKRTGYVHQNLLSASIKNGCGKIAMTVDPETATTLQRYFLTGALTEGVLLIVVDKDEFNRAFEEVAREEKTVTTP